MTKLVYWKGNDSVVVIFDVVVNTKPSKLKLHIFFLNFTWLKSASSPLALWLRLGLIVGSCAEFF